MGGGVLAWAAIVVLGHLCTASATVIDCTPSGYVGGCTCDDSGVLINCAANPANENYRMEIIAGFFALNFTSISAGAFANMKLKELTIDMHTLDTIAPGAFVNLEIQRQLLVTGSAVTVLRSGTFSNITAGTYISFRTAPVHTVEPGYIQHCSATASIKVRGLTQLTTLPPGSLVNITTRDLWIRSNAMLTLQHGSLSNIGKVEHVEIRNNQGMQVLPAGIFMPQPQVEPIKMGVQNNKALETIEAGCFEGVELLGVVIRDNNALANMSGVINGTTMSSLVIQNNAALVTLEQDVLSNATVLGPVTIKSNGITSLSPAFANGLQADSVLIEESGVTAMPPSQFGDMNCSTLTVTMSSLTTIAAEAFRGVTTDQLTLAPGTSQFGPSGGYLHQHMLSCSGVQALSLTAPSMTCAGGDTTIASSENLYIETGDGLLTLPGPLCENSTNLGTSSCPIPVGACGPALSEADTDGDGYLNNCANGTLAQDLCPNDPGKYQAGVCGCGTSDIDTDGDGYLDNCVNGTMAQDSCVTDGDKYQPGICGCGVPDIDSDGDGYLDNCANGGTAQDTCVNDTAKAEPGTCGCGTSDIDTDGDGYLDNCANGTLAQDGCPSDGSKYWAGACGCGVADTDTDSDGYLDNCANGTLAQDSCVNDANKFLAGACGCGTSDIDTDGDGYLDNCANGTLAQDACVNDSGKYEVGVCGCGSSDIDTDGDGHLDNCANSTLTQDGCPSDAGKAAPGACGCGTADVDTDGDGYLDNCVNGTLAQDGCPSDASKHAGGVCGCGTSDDDSDGDGYLDNCTNGTLAQGSCTSDPSKYQPGACGCGTSDDDSDGDGYLDNCANGTLAQDGCSSDANKHTPGACGCGVADVDSDGDGYLDNCANGTLALDTCPNDAGKYEPGVCGCGTSDVDTDGDGYLDNCSNGTLAQDGCPSDSEKHNAGVCGCGTSDVDTDGDYNLDNCSNGTLAQDACPSDSGKHSAGVCGCGTADLDTDGDWHLDYCVNGTLAQDECVNDAEKYAAGVCGCGTSDIDSDSDGYLDNCANGTLVQDSCLTDAGKYEPGACGCGTSDVDTDGDGYLDNCVNGTFVQDSCPSDAGKYEAGVCGCGTSDLDTDGDGYLDNCANATLVQDGCPNDGMKFEAGVCGCGTSDVDTDGDWHPDNCVNGTLAQDECVNDAGKYEAGVCGCGTSDVDSDGDGYLDNCADGSLVQDSCPNSAIKHEPGVCGCDVPEPAAGQPCSPIARRAELDLSLARLTITFSHSMRQTQPQPCGDALSPTRLGSAPVCVWQSASVLRVALGEASTVMNGTRLQLKAGLLSSQGVPSIASEVAVIVPALPPPPQVVIVGPDSIGLCASGTFDVGTSFNPGGRGLSFAWHLASVAGADLSLDTASSVEAAQGGESMDLQGTNLAPGGYVLRVNATDFLGRVAEATHLFNATLHLVPSLTLDSGSLVQSHSAADELRVKAEVAWASSCNLLAAMPAVNYSWALTSGPAVTGLASVALNKPTLTLPAGSLTPGSSYTFTCTAITSVGSDISATVAIAEVTQAEVVARIEGGALRTVSAGARLVLDGSRSANPNLRSPSASDTFSWQCSVVAGGGACPLSASAMTMLGSPSSPQLSLPPNSFVVSQDTEVEMSMTYTSMGSSATVTQRVMVLDLDQAVALEANAEMRVPGAALAAASTAPTGSRLEISVLVNASAPTQARRLAAGAAADVEWSVAVGQLDLGNVATTLPDSTLVIPTSALNPLQPLTLSAQATVTTASGSATLTTLVEVQPAGEPPRSGSLSGTLGANSSLTLRASGWVDDSSALPLTYSFWYAPGSHASAGVEWWLGLDGSSTSALLTPDSRSTRLHLPYFKLPRSHSATTFAVVVTGRDGQSAVGTWRAVNPSYGAAIDAAALLAEADAALSAIDQMAKQGNIAAARAALSSLVGDLNSLPGGGGSQHLPQQTSLRARTAALIASLSSSSDLSSSQQGRQVVGLVKEVTALPTALSHATISRSLRVLDEVLDAPSSGIPLLPSTLRSIAQALGGCMPAASINNGEWAVAVMNKALSAAARGLIPGEAAITVSTESVDATVQSVATHALSGAAVGQDSARVELGATFAALPALSGLDSAALQVVFWRSLRRPSSSEATTGTLSVDLYTGSGQAVTVQGLPLTSQPSLVISDGAGLHMLHDPEEVVMSSCEEVGLVHLPHCDDGLGFRLVHECEAVNASYISSCPATFRPPACGFWDEQADRWSGEGCEVLWASNSSVACRCSHFTDFAASFDHRIQRVDTVLAAEVTEESLLGSLQVMGVVTALLLIGCCGVSCLSWKARKDAKRTGTVLMVTTATRDNALSRSHVMQTLHDHGFRPSPDDDHVLHEPVTARHFCCNLCTSIRHRHRQQHPWARICCEKGHLRRPGAESMLLLTVVLLGNMMLSALRFDVEHLEDDFLARFDLEGLLYGALETAVLSALVRVVLVVMLRLGRALPPRELHPTDAAILRLTTKSWRSKRRRGPDRARLSSASSARSPSFLSPRDSLRSLRRLLSPGPSRSRKVRVAPLQVSPAPLTPITNAHDGKVAKVFTYPPLGDVTEATSTQGPQADAGKGEKAKVDEVKPAEPAASPAFAIVTQISSPGTQGVSPSAVLASPRSDGSKEPADCLIGLRGGQTHTVRKLKAAEHHIVPKLSKLGALTRLLGRLLLLPRSRRAAKRERSARCRRILVVCAYTLGALYCLACAVFCWLFSIAFGSTIATEWLLTWALAVCIGALVLQPLALCVQAVLRHYVAFKYANVFVNVVTG